MCTLWGLAVWSSSKQCKYESCTIDGSNTQTISSVALLLQWSDLYERCVAGRAVEADGWSGRCGPGAQWPRWREAVNSAGIEAGHRHYLRLEFKDHNNEEESIKGGCFGHREQRQNRCYSHQSNFCVFWQYLYSFITIFISRKRYLLLHQV